MSDNTVQNGTDTIATDDLATQNGGAVSGVKVQRIKVGYGSDSDYRDADPLHGVPVQIWQSQSCTPAAVAVNATSAVALASNSNRKGALFYNGTNVDVLLALNGTCSTTAFTVDVRAGGYYELPVSVVYTGAVSCLGVSQGTLTAAAAGSGSLMVSELT